MKAFHFVIILFAFIVTTIVKGSDFTDLCTGARPGSPHFDVYGVISDMYSLPLIPPLDLESCAQLEARIHATGVLQGDNVVDNHWGIHDLTAIGTIDSLKNLSLYNVDTSFLSDLSPLSRLQDLDSLSLTQRNAITDLRPLSGLINFTSLILHDSLELHSIRGLESLPHLRFLSLYNICIDDLSLLGSAPELARLEYGCPVRDLNFAQGLQHLEALRLWRADVNDLSPLFGIRGLRELLIDRNDFVLNLEGIGALTGLTKLHVGRVQNSQPLARLTRLENLIFSSSESSVADLSRLTHLKKLQILSENLVDVSGLSGMNALADLELHSSANLRLGHLQLPSITSLIVYNHGGNLSLENFSGMPNLRKITLSGGSLTDLTPLVQLQNVQELYLSNNKLTSLASLAHFTNLERLNVEANMICDVPQEVENLRYLHFNGNGELIRLVISGLDDQDRSDCP